MKLSNGFVLCLAIVCLQASRADTTWVASGNVSGAWNAAGSPYMIHEGDVTVATGDALTIGPGVTVYFAGPFKMDVNGLLQANGTAQDSIWLTGSAVDFPMDTPQRWKGLRFWDADSDCHLAYCSISYGGATGAGAFGYGGGLYTSGTELRVEHCRIHHCHASYGCGAYFDQSNVVLEDAEFKHNVGTLDPNFQVINGEIGGLGTANTVIHMRQCRVLSNHVGVAYGGIRFGNGTVATLDTCLISENRTDGGWAGISADAATVLSMRGTTISNHGPYEAGFTNGLRFLGERLYMDACTLRNNQASWIQPEPIIGDGGGALMILNPQSAVVQNSVFEGNSCEYGGALLCSNTKVTNCLFQNNGSENGSVCSIGGNVFENCQFIDNEATRTLGIIWSNGEGVGGGIFFFFGSDSVKSCLFEGNFSTIRGGEEGEFIVSHAGGAIFCDALASPYIVNCVFRGNNMNQFDCFGSGSVLYNRGGSPTLEYCTMDSNPASGGTYDMGVWGIYTAPGGVICSWGGSVSLNSCVISNSQASGGVILENGASMSSWYGDYHGISGGNFGGAIPAGLGEITTTNANSDSCDEFLNIFLDPSYVDAGIGDLHLSDASPCLGAADPLHLIDTDFEGHVRPDPEFSLPDIGAYESYLGGRFVPVEHLVITRAAGTNSMVLYWDSNPQAISYRVYSCPLPECTLIEMTLLGTTATTTFTDTDVLTLPDEQRYYVVMGSTAP